MDKPKTTITEIIEEELKDKIEALENKITILGSNINTAKHYMNALKGAFQEDYKNNESVNVGILFTAFDIIIHFLECEKRKIK